MLYITRRVGQSLMIGEDIEIIIEDVRGRTVKVGVRHPLDVSILRRELYDRIREEHSGGDARYGSTERRCTRRAARG